MCGSGWNHETLRVIQFAPCLQSALQIKYSQTVAKNFCKLSFSYVPNPK